MTEPVNLGTNGDGLTVVATDLELRAVGGGLTPAMRVDPAVFEQGDHIIVSYEAVVRSVRFDPIDKDDPTGEQARVHIAFPETAMVQLASKAGQLKTDLDAQRERIKRAEDAEKGILRLETDEELHAAHEAGDHASGLVEGCSDCEREAELASSENGDDVGTKRRRRAPATK